MRYENNNIDAEALLNEGFFKILSQLKKYDSNLPIEPWAKRIQINTVLDHYRKNKKFKELIVRDYDTEHTEMHPSALNDVEQRIETDFLLELMKKLPNATRTVFYLYAVDGMNYQEISEELQLSKGTIKWHVFEARKKLKTAFSKMASSVKQVV